MVGQLASRLSDEMRQPIGVMRNAVYFLNLHLGALDEKTRLHLTYMLRAVEEVTGIASNLTVLVGTETADRDVVDVQTLVSAALGRMQARPEVTIETAVDPGAQIFGDPSQLRLALTNVIDNSSQAMPGEGRIRIVCQRAGQETRIVITDDGPGMSEEVMAHAFEPFFTTSCHHVGIGLTVARRLAGSNAGTIAIDSTSGAGTTVRFSFPSLEGS